MTNFDCVSRGRTSAKNSLLSRMSQEAVSDPEARVSLSPSDAFHDAYLVMFDASHKTEQ